MAERGAMLPLGPSSRQLARALSPVSVVTLFHLPRSIPRWRILAPPSRRAATPGNHLSPPKVPPSPVSSALALERAELIPVAQDDPRPALEVLMQQPLVGRVRVAGRLGEPEQDDGQPELLVERR